MIKLLMFSLLALNAGNALAGNMYIYKDKAGEVKLTNVNPSGNFDKFTKKVKVTYYKDNDAYDSKSKEGELNQKQEITYGTSSSSNSNTTSYANSAYLALR